MTNTFLTLVRSLTLGVAVMILSCGGSEDPRPVAFESLDGSPGQFNEGSLADRVPYDVPWPGRGVSLFAVIRSEADLAPHRAQLAVAPVQMLPRPSRVLALTEPRYFDAKMLVLVDEYRLNLETIKLVRIVESADAIEVTFELCSFDIGPTGQIAQGTLWFAVAQSNKPVVVLPLQFAKTPPPNLGTPVGRCPGL